MPPEPPKPHTTPPLRGTHAGIGADDVILLWGGGIYEWLDPLTLIEGLAQRGGADVKLFFMGLTHPTPEVAPAPMAGAAVALAERLELKDRVVFFNPGWVPYDQRSGFLLDADVGVSTHLRHVESTYAFRTRVIDYIWARLPILCSEGDTLADLVADRDVGEVVPVGDPAAVAAAVDRLCDPHRRRACSERMEELAEDLSWDKVCAPLVEFCRDPGRAPDLVAPEPHAWHWARVHEALAGLRERVARRARGSGAPRIRRGKVFTDDQ
jgi:glycosyltransferase involved in cell wall biosynthesis